MWVDYHLLPDRELVYLVTAPAFCLLAAGLFLGRRGVTQLCASRLPVALGRISYGIFLGHGFLLIAREYLLESGRLSAASSPVLIAGAIAAYLGGSIVIGWLLWRYVEEPASRTMNAMVPVR
ncbi:hypothetical protein GCM10025875_01840 [Litorihabitans aurantiacus]|uniref:Acyltransferase family protein n=2 Tax=Litorihabitans aurantiacus TaxID=1930061 RepID=A0AA37UT16_9MICO|nr:hypothetical protein GCM10025875_01840 [Litorihabitans aurantiacus]